jgi:hypothetical protein
MGIRFLIIKNKNLYCMQNDIYMYVIQDFELQYHKYYYHILFKILFASIGH